MIPQIQVLQKNVPVEQLIADFAEKYSIEPALRIRVTPEKEGLTVEQIHLLLSDIQVAFSKTVLVVLEGVDDSSHEVQNALLKTLEEESHRIQFLLIVHTISRLLPTILSRCSYLQPQYTELPQMHSTDYKTHFSFTRNGEVKKEEAVARIDSYILTLPVHRLSTLTHLLSVRKLIIDNNMNPILALDSILIFLSKPSTIKLSQ